MEAGKLKYKITFSKPTSEPRRGIPQAYETVCQAWADIVPTTVKETDSNGQLKVFGTYKITCWNNRQPVNETWRITLGNEVFNIASVIVTPTELQITAVKDK